MQAGEHLPHAPLPSLPSFFSPASSPTCLPSHSLLSPTLLTNGHMAEALLRMQACECVPQAPLSSSPLLPRPHPRPAPAFTPYPPPARPPFIASRVKIVFTNGDMAEALP